MEWSDEFDVDALDQTKWSFMTGTGVECGIPDWWTTGFDFPAPFDKRFHLLINLAVGGNWPGAPDGTTQFPQNLINE